MIRDRFSFFEDADLACRVVVIGMVVEFVARGATPFIATPSRYGSQGTTPWRIVPALLILLLAVVATPVSARITVGTALTCDVPTIQAAIDRLLPPDPSNRLNDRVIAIAGGNFNEALSIDARGVPNAIEAPFTLIGGYAADCSGPGAGGSTRIDASGLFASGLSIHGEIDVTLANLIFTQAITPGNGGGIAFDGTGVLRLVNVGLIGNQAGRGGGLYANGAPEGLTIYLDENSDVLGNAADHAGGGIRVEGNTRLIMTSGSTVSNNKVRADDAEGAGGGIQVVGPARVDIGSGVITSNEARYGGGIWVGGGAGADAVVRFFSTRPGDPTRIDLNVAAQAGGGVFVSSQSVVSGAPQSGIVCGFGYSISRNAAAEGAAIYAANTSPQDSVFGSVVDLRASVLHDTGLCGDVAATNLGALNCPAGSACNAIDGNVARTASGDPTDGSIVVAKAHSVFEADQLELRGNVGEHLWHGFATEFALTCSNCLVADNRVDTSLVRMDDGGSLAINSSTLAGNTIAGATVLSLSGDLSLTNSLVWQPGKTTLDQAAGRARAVSNVLASEIASLSGGIGVAQTYPLFRDPIHGDYRLSPYSPALDYAAATDGQDLVGLPRSVDLSIPDRPGGGPLDLGAYELQADEVFPPDEHFDAVGAPELPPEWINVQNGTGPGWVTTTTTPASGPNAAFVADPPSVSDNSLLAPAVLITNKGRLRFRYKMDLEAAGDLFARDGVVLEMAIGNGAFADIQIAGGTFVSGGYDHVIPFSGPPENPPNPLLGRSVWSGTTGENYKDVVVDLPAFADGKIVRLKWRIGTNISNEAPHAGYWLDDVHLDVDGIGELFCSNFEEGAECQ